VRNRGIYNFDPILF